MTTIEPRRMKGSADAASGLFSILANPKRLMILCCLADGEASVGDLAAFCGSAQSGVSQHLALLRSNGIVETRREAQTIFYRLTSAPARAIIEAAYEVFCRRGAGRAAKPRPKQ